MIIKLISMYHILFIVTFVLCCLFSDLLLIMVSILIITVSLQNFSLSTFFFLVSSHSVSLLYVCFDFNCEMTLLTVSYYASQDTLL